MIAIIDYDAGNIKSVEKALGYLGEEAVITKDRDIIMSSDKVILPGVGCFKDAMDKIREYKLDNVIYDVYKYKDASNIYYKSIMDMKKFYYVFKYAFSYSSMGLDLLAFILGLFISSLICKRFYKT